jgi:hypothetical protein
MAIMLDDGPMKEKIVEHYKQLIADKDKTYIKSKVSNT